MDSDRLLFLKAFMEVITLEHLRYRVLRGQLDEIFGREFREPAAIKINYCLLRIQNLKNLCLIGFRVSLNVLARQRGARYRPPRRIANHSREIANQKNDGVAQ